MTPFEDTVQEAKRPVNAWPPKGRPNYRAEKPNHDMTMESRTEFPRPLRILLLTRHFRGGDLVPIERGGGTESFIASVLKLPADVAGLEIDVVAPRPEGSVVDDPAGVRVSYFPADFLTRLLFVFRNARNPVVNVLLLIAGGATLARHGMQLAKVNRYDVIYAVGGPIAGLAGILVKAYARVPLAMHFHFAYAFSKSNALVRACARRFYSLADVVIGNCPTFARDAAALGIPQKRCTWVLNWVDGDRFRPRDDRESLRGARGLTPDQTVLLFIGRFDWTKNADRIIDALRDFEVPGVVHLFAGSGELTPQLEELARASPSVRLLGTVGENELAELHNAADFQFWGSRDVDYPSLVVMEAMTSGLPVLTSLQTFNHFYEGQEVDVSVLGDPRYARHYPPTRDGIRQSVRDAVALRSEFGSVRGEIAQFARERFGVANAQKLLRILRRVALDRRFGVAHGSKLQTRA